ncbi:hypothetical protein CL633_01300 [bacterium]|nr:hypothetical protein [bacterium]|tara:strand:+ start:4806 stop:5720 length:915 start_codon:yes stop_codon:yes gene_type:complete
MSTKNHVNWRYHFKVKNLLTNSLLVFIPASLILAILKELGIGGVIIMIGIFYLLIYLIGSLRARYFKKYLADYKKWESEKKLHLKIIDKKYIPLFVIIGLFVMISLRPVLNKNFYQNSNSNLNNNKMSIEDWPEEEEQVGNLYKNQKYQFSIEFPKGWEQKDGNNKNILRIATKGRNSMNIMIQEMPKWTQQLTETDFSINEIMTIEEFTKITMESIKLEYLKSDQLDSGTIKIDGKNAYWIKYVVYNSMPGANTALVMIQYQLMHKNIFYSITTGSTQEEFESVEPVFKKSLSTFSFENFEKR